MPDKDAKLVIRTAVSGWLNLLATAYKVRTSFILEDDAHIGVDPREDSLLRMGLKAKLSSREWAGVLISLGMAGIGAWLLVLAVLDPEPYSKVAATVVTGAVLLGTGGLIAVRILTHLKPPNIRVSNSGAFEISWM